MKNIEKAALLEYSDLALTNEEKEEIIYNCYDGKCTYNGKTLNVKGDMPDRGRIIVNEDGTTFENIIIKGYNCIKENNKFTCNNTGLTKVNGTSILIDNNKTTEIENYRIYGNSIQNGEPTPDTPVEVESVGDLVTLDNCETYGSDACNNVGKYVIPIKVTGKNLFDINNYSKESTKDYLQFNIDNLTVGRRYTFSSQKDITWLKISSEPSGYNSVSYDNFEHKFNQYKFTMQKNSKISSASEQYLFLGLSTLEVGFIKNVDELFEYNIQIELGNKATEYEPYKEAITNIYLDEPLRSIGEYSDYIDFKSGKVVRRVKRLNINNILNWKDNYFPTLLFILNSNEIAKPNTIVLNNYSDKKRFGITNIEGTGIGFYNCDTYWNFNNLNEMKTWLDSHKDMYANYVLQNPIEQTINLPKLSINKDTSVISINTNIVPSSIELEYYR